MELLWGEPGFQDLKVYYLLVEVLGSICQPLGDSPCSYVNPDQIRLFCTPSWVRPFFYHSFTLTLDPAEHYWVCSSHCSLFGGDSCTSLGFPGGTRGKELPTNAGNVGDSGLVPGWGRSPGGGQGNPLQCSCLENPMDRGAWWATVHGVAKSWTQLKRLNTHTY